MQKSLTLSFIIIYFLFIATFESANAQEKPKVDLKKDVVYVNGKGILKYEKSGMSSQYSFFSMNDDTEILLFLIKDNETPGYAKDDYVIINFLTKKRKVETANYSHLGAFPGGEKLIEWLLKEKVLNENGELNPERVEIFAEKYHEDVTERTVR